MLQNVLKYVENIESEIDQLLYSKYRSETTRFSLVSYALYVRAKNAQIVANCALELFKRAGFNKLCLEALGWLLVALSTDKNTNTNQLIETIYNT